MTDQATVGTLGAVATRPPFDPELVPVEEAVRAFLPTFSDETLATARELEAKSLPGVEPVDLTAGGRVRVEERQVLGPAGAPDISLLILSPVEDRGPKAGIYYVHGGGMVVGSRRSGVGALLQFVAEGNAVVVSVEYRLAPE